MEINVEIKLPSQYINFLKYLNDIFGMNQISRKMAQNKTDIFRDRKHMQAYKNAVTMLYNRSPHLSYIQDKLFALHLTEVANKTTQCPSRTKIPVILQLIKS